MRGLHDSYPQYGFDSHVGYATAVHQAAICEHGVCELHRLSFASVAYQQLGLDLGAGASSLTRRSLPGALRVPNRSTSPAPPDRHPPRHGARVLGCRL